MVLQSVTFRESEGHLMDQSLDKPETPDLALFTDWQRMCRARRVGRGRSFSGTASPCPEHFHWLLQGPTFHRMQLRRMR